MIFTIMQLGFILNEYVDITQYIRPVLTDFDIIQMYL